MLELWQDSLIGVFILFCRIGGCLMVIPGYGSVRVSLHIRLFLALAVTLALSPLLLPAINAAVPDFSFVTLLTFSLGELYVGILIGVIGRAFFAALEMIGTLAAMSTGITSIPGATAGSEEPLPVMAGIFSLTALVLIFLTDLHWELIAALVDSYTRLPPAGTASVPDTLDAFVDSLSATFRLALQIGSPFIVYSLCVNLASGLTNKLTPQVPVYFVIMPVMIAGSLLLAAFLVREMLVVFIDAYGNWLRFG